MKSLSIIHSCHQINPSKILSHLVKGEKYFKHYNTYLIPYQCQDINYNNRLIMGNFIYPMWNTLERAILSNNTDFSYNYLKGNDFTIEYVPSKLGDYHIFGNRCIYPNRIRANSNTLQPNSMLLFPIPKELAIHLIENKLL